MTIGQKGNCFWFIPHLSKPCRNFPFCHDSTVYWPKTIWPAPVCRSPSLLPVLLNSSSAHRLKFAAFIRMNRIPRRVRQSVKFGWIGELNRRRKNHLVELSRTVQWQLSLLLLQGKIHQCCQTKEYNLNCVKDNSSTIVLQTSMNKIFLHWFLV